MTPGCTLFLVFSLATKSKSDFTGSYKTNVWLKVILFENNEMSIGAQTPHLLLWEWNVTPVHISFQKIPFCNESNYVLAEVGELVHFLMKPREELINKIHQTHCILEALSVFIYPGPGSDYVGLFSQGLWKNKTIVHPNFLSWKALVSFNVWLLFILAFRAAQGPTSMSLSVATGVFHAEVHFSDQPLLSELGSRADFCSQKKMH